MIKIQRAGHQDKKAIFEFIKQAYTGRWQYKIPHRWQWEFVKNPYLDGDELPIFIAINADGEVVGQICTMVERLKVGKKIYRVGWSVDNFVLPSYRKQGIGSELQKANFEANDIFLSVSMADVVRKIKKRLGSVQLSPVGVYRRYHKYNKDQVRHEILARYTPTPGVIRKSLSGGLHVLLLDRILAWLKGMTLYFNDRRLSGMMDPDLKISACLEFPEDVDRLWEQVSLRYDAIIQRDRVFLNWKFVQQPHMDYKCYIARRHDEICGYLVLRIGRTPEPKIGILADLVVDPLDDITLFSMLAYAVSYFRKEKVREILVASSVKEYQNYFWKLGFVKVREEIPMIHMKNENPTIKTLLESGSWFFGTSDHDWDQYPLAK